LFAVFPCRGRLFFTVNLLERLPAIPTSCLLPGTFAMRATLALTLLAGIGLLGPARVSAGEPLFGREVVPVLYKLGCSSGACHGAFAGKGNFRLSLFASDPAADFKSI